MATPMSSDAASPKQSSTTITVTLTPAFKLVFLSVLGITVLSMVLSCYLVASGAASEDKTALVQACLTTWKLGFGAIIGLLGGKAI